MVFDLIFVIQGHTEMLVYLASAHRHCSGPVLEDTLIILPEILNHAVHDLSFAMTKLEFIYMETDSHLFAFNLLIGDARIVWVDREVNVRQTLDELPIVQKACNHFAIQGVQALYQQLFRPILVLRDI
jgi:hypothetical protein